MQGGSTRLKVELSASVACAALATVTLIWRDWTEMLFRVDPDAGSGAFEWALVIALAAATAAFALAARVEWARTRGAES